MADEPIKKGAVVAAAITALGITYFMIDKNRRCKSFTKVWADPEPLGGLNLEDDVIDDAVHWTRRKLRSIISAGETPDREVMHEELANYIADCDWDDSRKTKKGRQVWDSLGKIVNTTFAEYNADPAAFMMKSE